MHPALRLPAGALIATGLMLSTAKIVRQAKAAEPAAAASSQCHHVAMSDAEMKRWVNEFYATHPKVGDPSIEAAIDTFLATGTVFDTDHNLATQVDTMTIIRGQTVLWKWMDGTHSVTSGKSGDINAGSLFDQPLDVNNPTFSFTFNTSGTFDFFCRPHVTFGMRGVVVVRALTDVRPADGDVESSGFVGAPVPNPSHGDVTVEFALRTAGRARLEVFDVAGREVAVALDRDLGAGRWQSQWDGRTQDGRAASAGVYYLRLQVPERVET